MHRKIFKLLPTGAWKIKDKPLLSTRRLIGLMYYKIKRIIGRDLSFLPPEESTVPIDIFMPCIEKDAEMLVLSIEYARKYIKHPIDTIYIVAPRSSKKLRTIADDQDCIFIAEDDIIDYQKEKIDYKVGNLNRNGWIYKMLINLTADKVCKNRFILVLDADTLFIGPQIFMYKNRPLFNVSNEYHQPYYDASTRLLGFKHTISRSFITHYMIFDAEVLRSLRLDIEKKWRKPWYEAIIDCIDKREPSGFADYEIYGDYYIKTASQKPIINYWSNESLTLDSRDKLDDIICQIKPYFRSVSLHNYQETLDDK